MLRRVNPKAWILDRRLEVGLLSSISLQAQLMRPEYLCESMANVEASVSSQRLERPYQGILIELLASVTSDMDGATQCPGPPHLQLPPIY
jgi:hypothetical protein